MRVSVLLFAALREAAGRGQVSLDLLPGATIAEAFDALAGRYPALAQFRPYLTFAVNREVVPAESTLREGDELALLQPVSGGCE